MTTTNALPKTIEITASKNIPLLNFGIWGRRGLNDLKVANGFERFEIPPYVAADLKGQLALKWKLHRGFRTTNARIRYRPRGGFAW